MSMQAPADVSIHPLLAARWSPYAFADRPVAAQDLRALFEAVRWAPSSYNAQPWHYLLATREQPEEFGRLLTCLVEQNQAWAKFAPVLALGISRLHFSHNDKPNRAALHDLGLASAQLLVEATARGLAVHQMIGILPEKARELYQVPEGFEILTGLAIGYLGDPKQLPEAMQERDSARRPRKPVREFLFSGRWGEVSPLAK